MSTISSSRFLLAVRCVNGVVQSVNGTIYLLRTDAFLKIGWTGQVPWDRRLHQIRNASPYDVEVLAARPGTLEQEQELHAGAEQWRHKGDWYNDCLEFRIYCDRFFYPVWTCPDCGFDKMPHPPKDYNICPKCMVEFGNDDKASTGDPNGTPADGCTDGPQSSSVSEQTSSVCEQGK